MLLANSELYKPQTPTACTVAEFVESENQEPNYKLPTEYGVEGTEIRRHKETGIRKRRNEDMVYYWHELKVDKGGRVPSFQVNGLVLYVKAKSLWDRIKKTESSDVWIPIFYTLTKIHKPTPVGRPIISGCDGPTEKLSWIVDKILQPTDFINFVEKTKLPKGDISVSMDVTSFYTNIPQEEGINIVCTAYETFYNETPPIPKRLLGKALRLILQEKSFQSV